MIRPGNLLVAKAATGVSSPEFVGDMDKTVFTLHTTASCNATVKFVGGFKDAPVFSTASSNTNDWHYIEVVNVDDGSVIDGSTGVAMTGTDFNTAYMANVDKLKWIGAVVTAYSAGAINVSFTSFAA